jgi:SAM-dependent methyltransferase
VDFVHERSLTAAQIYRGIDPGTIINTMSRAMARPGRNAREPMEPDEYARMAAVEDGMWWYRALHTRLLEALADQPAASRGPTLDAGCGTGGLLTLINPSHAAYGLEWNADAAAIAAAKSGRPIARGSINELPFASDSFGTAIAADVLCHAAVEPARALAEIKRVLRPQGRLIVNMPAFRALMSAHDARVHNARRMNLRETRAMLEDAGFRVLRAGYWNGLLLPLMILHRKFLAGSSERSDVAVFPPWLDRMLHGMTELERRLHIPLPAGGSVLAVAERP